MINENFLHYIWKHRLFQVSNLKTITGEFVTIVAPGLHNHDSGPDFFNAKVKIGNTLWAGSVEIHINSSDWYVHNHEEDKAYDNVVLHVVAKYDKDVYRKNGSVIPTLVLPIDSKYISNYNVLMQSKRWIPCEDHFPQIDASLKSLWVDSLLLERLERKSDVVTMHMAQTNNDFDEVFFRLLCRNLGFKTNAQPFEHLSRKVTLRMIRSLGSNVKRIESLLFGVAGFLSDSHSEYQLELKKEFSHLAKKFSLTSLDKSIWKFARMRPLSFPTVRIAQLAQLLSRQTQFTQFVKSASSIEQLYELFMVSTSEFWMNHYTFDKISDKKEKPVGRSSVDNVIINTVFPLLFVMSKYFDDAVLQQKTLEWMAQIPAEKNNIVNRWRDLGVQMESAIDSQAYIELYNEYCMKSRCLSCRLGAYIIREM